MEVIISEIFVDFLYDITAGKQGLQFPGNTGTGIVDKRADDGIIAGVFPVARRQGFGISLKIAQIIHDVPGAVDIEISEMIPVIPVFYVISMILSVRVGKKLIYILLSETEVFIQMGICNGIGDEVIGSSKDAFF